MALTEPSRRSTLYVAANRHFYTARYSFQGRIGCANCHIDSTFDGLQWDLEPDGLGPRHRGQPPARGHQRHRAIQVEWRQPEPAHRVRAADGEVLLALGKLRRSHARGPDVHTLTACLRGPIAGGCPAANSRRRRSAAKRSSSAQWTSLASRSRWQTAAPIAIAGRQRDRAKNPLTWEPRSRRRFGAAGYAAVDRTLRSPRHICTTGRRRRSKRSGQFTIPTTSTGAPTT